MAYTALYRKWRPLTFDDVVGQNGVTQTLKNEIKENRIGHAYLFCGIRGTGKTSTARILSRAINCLNPQDGNPCNKCENCRGILDGSILDITEIDAASNNGVDNIRSLREEARFTGSVLKERVYIIDEVHMLSTSAFNALLKILEEPPAHVHFILATTEAQKVPATILSRCQRFDFKSIKKEDIESQIQKILSASDIKYDETALNLISTAADGSMRDALSILEQCISVGNNYLSYDEVSEFLGVTDDEYIISLITSIANSDVAGAFKTVGEIVENGKSIPPIANSLMKKLRDILVSKYSGTDSELSALFTPQRLLHITQIAAQIPNLLRTSVDMRLVFELSLVKMIDPSYDESYDAIVARLSEVEEKLKNGVTVKKEAPTEKPAKKAYAPKPVSNEVKTEKNTSTVLKKAIDKLTDDFQLTLVSALQEARLENNGTKYILLYPSRDSFDAAKQLIEGKEEKIEQIFEEITGEHHKIELKLDEKAPAQSEDKLNKLYNNNKDLIN